MTEIKINFSSNELVKKLIDEMPGELQKITNDIATRARKRAIELLSERYTLKKSAFTEGVRVRKANSTDLEATITASGYRLGIAKFQNEQTPSGITYTVVRGQQKEIASGFKATMKSGHVGVFKRKGNKFIPTKGSYAGRIATRGRNKGQPIMRQKIAEQYRISVAEMFGSQAIQEQLDAFIQEEFIKAIADVSK